MIFILLGMTTSVTVKKCHLFSCILCKHYMTTRPLYQKLLGIQVGKSLCVGTRRAFQTDALRQFMIWLKDLLDIAL